MKVAIIGAGNMGGAIARGMAKGKQVNTEEIWVANPSQGKLDALKGEFPALHVTHSNWEAAEGAELVILAVKPWLIEQVCKEIDWRAEGQIVGSVAAGISIERLSEYTGGKAIFRIVPNTAISLGQSMTLMACRGASE